MCEELVNAWNDRIDIVFTDDNKTYMINTLFKQAIDCAFNIKMDPYEEPEEVFNDIDDTWTCEEDNLLLDSYFKIQHLYRGDDLWSKLTYIIHRDNPESNKLQRQYKQRLEKLLDDYDYKLFINQQVQDLDSEEQEDSFSEFSDDYFNDPYANYCDICSLNVFDCDC